MSNKKRCVGIVGIGRIGSRCAYSLVLQGLVDELVLLDLNPKRALGDASDLNDCMVHLPGRVRIRRGAYEDLARCDIIVISAGIMSDSRDRLSLLQSNSVIVDSIVEQVMNHNFKGIFIVLTNPCDVLAHRVARLCALDRGRVFSTGTLLDSSRLRKELSFATDVDPKSINALVMGEHGASQMIPWSAVNVLGQPIGSLAAKDPRWNVDRELIAYNVANAAWVAVEGKGTAEYGVAACLARCVRAVFNDERVVLPLGAELRGEYGVDGLFAGVPAVLGQNGVQSVMEIDMTPDEKARFHASCEALRNGMAKL